MKSRIGRFEIQAEIGRGGFGQVFRALDPVMNRVVAVKVLTATDDASALDRFKKEATAAGNLQHENIVSVYEFGQEGGMPYLVMQYLNGVDLQHVIKSKQPMSLYHKVRIMDQVADGLYCAHCNGVLHRDIKPANVMVLQDYTAKIMDFGIARLTRDTSTRLTQEGYLIGTITYMAPELFSQAEFEVDALCDIWSYGVIFYELLDGKNPFQTGSVQSEMYRILHQDPPELPAEVCPPELQQVVAKLLSRPRQRRYQSLEDARFDLQPILKNLEKAEADRHLSHAQQLLFQQQWSEAMVAAREARKLDPQNVTAKIIFERAQNGLERVQVQPRIADMIKQANALAAERKIGQAIERLEEARNLDRGNEKVLGRLQELRTLQQRMDEAAKWVSEADKEYRDNRVTVAFDRVSEAVSLDPENPDARSLYAKVQSEIHARELERAVQDELRRAGGLMATDDLDGALAVVNAADGKYPGRGDIRDLQARLQQLIAERARRVEYQRRLEQAKLAVRNMRYEQAVSELEHLQTSFPSETETAGLLAYARQELKSKLKSEEVKRLTSEAAEHTRKQRFTEAIQLLEEGQKKYQDDPLITRALRTAHADYQNFKRERDLREGLAQCEALRQGARWQEALDVAERLISEHPGNKDLRDLKTRIRQEKDAAERSTAVGTAVNKVETLLRSGKPDQAVAEIESAIVTLGGQGELTGLLQKAKDAQRAERERQYVESRLKEAEEFEHRGDITASVRIVEDALLRYSNSAKLLAARERLNGVKERARHDEQVSQGAAGIKGALDRKDWTTARAKLGEVTKLFPTESVFSNLEEELRQAESAHIDQLIREGRRLLNSGDVAGAEQFIKSYLLEHKDRPEVKALGGDVVAEKRRLESRWREEQQKAQLVAECLAASQECERNGKLEEARDAIRIGLGQHPQDAVLKAQFNRLNELIESARYNQVSSKIKQALERSNWELALQYLEQAKVDYPNDPALIPLQSEALRQRSAFLESAAAAIRGKLDQDNLDDARALFNESLARFPELNISREVAGALAAVEAKRSATEQRRGYVTERLKQAALFEEQGEFPRAVSLLEKALEKYPTDRELTSERRRLTLIQEQSERERALAAKTTPIKSDLNAGKWAEAQRKLAEARAIFPENAPELDALEEQARRQRDGWIQLQVSLATDCAQQGKLAEAEKILTKQLAPFAGETAVANLANALKGERWRENLLQKARDQIAGQRFAEAEAAIGELTRRRPNDPAADALRRDMDAAREQDSREKLYRSGRAEAERLLGNRQYAEAIERLEGLLRQFPRDRQLEKDLASARAKIEKATKPAQAVVESAAVERQPRMRLYAIGGAVLLVVAAAAGFIFWPRQAAIEVSPASVSFRYQPGVPLQPQKIVVTGASNAAVPQSGVDWVTVTRGESAAGKTEFLVQASPGNLSPGSHSTDLTVAQRTVRVDLVIAEPPKPQFDVQPASLTFPYSPGAIAAQTILVTSPSGISDPKASDRWVSVTRSDRGPGKAEFSVQVSTRGLAPGTHFAELAFAEGKKVQVELTIPGQSAEPPLEVQPSYLAFPDARGGMQLTVRASGPSVIPNPTAADAWISVTRRDTGRGKADFLVKASTTEAKAAGLQAGRKYTAFLNFSSQVKVRVELTMPSSTSPGGGGKPVETQLDVQPSELSFTFNHLSPPRPQSIMVTGAAEVPDPEKSEPWITVTRHNAGPNKTEFSVQATADKLAPGEYRDRLVFPRDKRVPVSLTVFDLPERFCYAQGASTWGNGALNANEDLFIKGGRVQGPGRVDPPLPTCAIVVDSSKLPDGLKVLENPSQENNFRLHLRTERPLSSFTIPWTKK